ncbi:MAG: hypothetical protein U0797_11815 [Gemmataceae bacterium]
MNLLCPNCQKMLTVPEQFAGQLMKCPLCSGTFTVPALPAGASDPAVPTTSAPASEPEKAFTPPPLPAAPSPAAPSEPAFTTSAPKAEPKPPEPKPAEPKPGPTAPVASDGYGRVVRLAANVAVLQWVPLGAVVLIFLLQFFPWVGVYPGGVPAVTQNAWGAAFGDYTADPDMKSQFRIITPAEAADANERKSKDETKEVSNAPGFGPLTFFYLIPFFLVTLAFTTFVAVQPHLTMRLPPQLEQLLPYKWPILAGLNVILLLFLSLQLVLNFSLESSVTNWVESLPEVKKEKDPSTPEQKRREAKLGNYLGQIRRTNYLRLAYFLHVVSTAAAGLVYWVERRGPGRPLPAIELKW